MHLRGTTKRLPAPTPQGRVKQIERGTRAGVKARGGGRRVEEGMGDGIRLILILQL